MKEFRATVGMNWIFDLWNYLNNEAYKNGHADAHVLISDGRRFMVSERVGKIRTTYLNGVKLSTDAITRKISDLDTAAWHKLHP